VSLRYWLLLLCLILPGLAMPGLTLSDPLRAEPAILQILDSDDRTLAEFSVTPGERWCLHWNHSVAGFEVRDCYVHRDGRMVLERSHQPDFAAGLGHIPGRGRQISDGTGGYRIEDIDEPVPGNRLVLRVGSKAVDHRLVFKNTELSLSRLHARERVVIRLSTP
jgi:hypothetical protein